MEDPDVIFIGRKEGSTPNANDVLPVNYFAQETQGRLSPQSSQAKAQHDQNNNQSTGAPGLNELLNAEIRNAEIRVADMYENMLQGNDYLPDPTWTYRAPYRTNIIVNGTLNHYPAETVTSTAGTSTTAQPGFPFQHPHLNAYRPPEYLLPRNSYVDDYLQAEFNVNMQPHLGLNANNMPDEHIPILRNDADFNVVSDWIYAAQTAMSGAALPGGQPRTRKNAYKEPVRRNPPRSAKAASYTDGVIDLTVTMPNPAVDLTVPMPNRAADLTVPMPHRAVDLTVTRQKRAIDLTVTRQKQAKAIPAAKAAPAVKTKAKSQDGRQRKIQKGIEPLLPPLQPQPSTSAAGNEESDYQRLLSLQASSLVSCTENAFCPVCQNWVLAGEGVILKDCLHTFCRKCLQNAVLNSQMAEVRCPFASEEYSCESHLQDCEVRCLVSPEDYERHLGKSVFQARCQATNAFYCMTPDCTGWCILDSDILEFQCPVCNILNCISCAEIHKPGDYCARVMLLQVQDGAHSLAGPSAMIEETNMSSVEPGQDYNRLLELSDMGLVTNKEKFDCPICFCDIEVGEGVILKDCLHNFCRECLGGTVHHSETVVVKCPFVSDEYACDSFLQEREIKSLVSPAEYERHLARSLAQVEHQSTNSFHCKTPDCIGWCLFEENANEFYCQTCNHTNCLGCGAIHEGQNCKQYQELLEFNSDTNTDVKKTRDYLEKQVKKNLAMKCPTCQVIVMKRDGCDFLICSMCKTDICWVTKGPRWGPGGKFDRSGGCGCDWKNGKPCHPKCGNCH